MVVRRCSSISSRNHRQYDALIFFTYLYAPTVLGLDVDPARSILVPTAHDEPAIHLSIYRDMFAKPRPSPSTPKSRRTFSRRRSSSGRWPRKRSDAAST